MKKTLELNAMNEEIYEQARTILALFYSEAEPANVFEKSMKALPLYGRHRIAVGLLCHMVDAEGITELPKDLHTCFKCCLDSLQFFIMNKVAPEYEMASLDNCLKLGRDALGKLNVV